MIDLRPHIQIALRALEMEHAQLVQRQQEINGAYQELLRDALPVSATLDGYELARGAHNEPVGLRLKPLPGTDVRVPDSAQPAAETPVVAPG